MEVRIMKNLVFMTMATALVFSSQRVSARFFEDSDKIFEKGQKTLISNESVKTDLYKTFDIQDSETESGGVAFSQQTTVSGPFKGTWTLQSNNAEGKLTLDLYNKSVTGMTFDGDDVKCYGTIYIGMTVGLSVRTDECLITECLPNGNKATVKFVGGRDGNTYQAILTYNPTTKKITVSDCQRLGDEEFGECYVTDGLIFSK